MTNYFSQEGLDKLKQELTERETVIRAEIAKRILEAKELGDLSENAEYAEAREAQGMNEGRIQELKDVIKNASLIGPNHQHKSVVVGSTVSVKHGSNERKYTIVGASESNPSSGYISNESPLGVAFLGKKKGDEYRDVFQRAQTAYSTLSDPNKREFYDLTLNDLDFVDDLDYENISQSMLMVSANGTAVKLK